MSPGFECRVGRAWLERRCSPTTPGETLDLTLPSTQPGPGFTVVRQDGNCPKQKLNHVGDEPACDNGHTVGVHSSGHAFQGFVESGVADGPKVTGRTVEPKVGKVVVVDVHPCSVHEPQADGMQDTVQLGARDKLLQAITSSICKPQTSLTGSAWLGG